MKTIEWFKLLAIILACFVFTLISCTKEAMLPDGKEPIMELTDAICGDPFTISDYTWELDLPNSKLILRHTQALRTMARSGNINPLQSELCNLNTRRVNKLKTGHRSDINNIGFAPQLEIEGTWIIAMYHPNYYPDHFIIYNIESKDWIRYEEGKTTRDGRPAVVSKGNGD